MRYSIKKWTVIIFLSLIGINGFSETKSEDSNDVLLKRLNFQEIVGILERGLGLKIGFAQTPDSYCKKMTYKEKLNELEAIDPTDRTGKEKKWIKIWEDLLQKRPVFINSSYTEYPRFTIKVPKRIIDPASVKELLERIAALDKRYSLVLSNTVYVLSDKDSIANTKRVTLELKDASPQEALQALSKALDNPKIGLNSLPPDTKNAKVTLHLNNVTLAEALSRLAEALGPNIRWEIFEGDQMISISFGEVSKEDDFWSDPLLR